MLDNGIDWPIFEAKYSFWQLKEVNLSAAINACQRYRLARNKQSRVPGNVRK